MISIEKVESASEIILRALWNGEPEGSLRLSLLPPLRKAHVEQLVVERDFVAQALLQEAEALLRQAHYLMVEWSYESDNADIIEAVLKEQSWSPSGHLLTRYKIDLSTFSPSWLLSVPALPSGFTEFRWDELASTERRQLKVLISQGAIPVSVSPFGDDEKDIEPTNSLGLRVRGVVEGWMVTHRVSPDTIKYSALYVDRAHRHKGIVIRLLVDSIRLQQNSAVRYATFEINPGLVNASWLRFVQQRLAPYAMQTQTLRTAYKELADTSAP